MVRTVRSMEEEARVRLVSGAGLDEALADPALLETLEGPTVERVIAWAADGGRRVLVVGLEDRGRIALALAKAGLFVTVVEPDESLHEPVKVAADQAKCGIRLNFYASDYMKREFASSGFDVAVFYSALSRYNEPVVVLRKAAREVRAGGRVFARVRVRPPVGGIRKVLARFPAVEKAAALAGARVADLASRLPGVAAVASLQDAAALAEECAEVFKVETVERRHVIAPFVAWLARRNPAAALLLPAALRADAAILGIPGASAAAAYVHLWGTKELGLGRTFRVV
ncbi:MAG: methyltransferase domain-containing protein [Deltaproteobacteria bacterium]|nr:methyltransferase domain-containing protein [Deltaproteobacteria bacterium]